MFHIIDDQKYISELLSDIIADFGYSSKSFLCPIEYISYTKSPEYKHPIAVFSDVRMPSMNGFEMMDIILDSKPNLNFILMSGYTSESDSEKYQPLHYLPKPFSMTHLLEILGTLIKDYERNGQTQQP